MDKRYHEETKSLRESDKDLKVEMQTLLRKYKLPSFCGKKLYFALFYARNVREFGLKLLTFIIGFGGIPGLVTFLVKKLVLDTKKDINVAFWCALIAAGTLIVLLLIYFAIYSKTKLKHMDAMTQARSIRDKMIANKKQANAIRHSINKDHDDSQYNLDAYDEKMDNLDAEADAIGKEKQEALRSFEEETTSMITEEINNRRELLEALYLRDGEIKSEYAEYLNRAVIPEEDRKTPLDYIKLAKYCRVIGDYADAEKYLKQAVTMKLCSSCGYHGCEDGY